MLLLISYISKSLHNKTQQNTFLPKQRANTHKNQYKILNETLQGGKKATCTREICLYFLISFLFLCFNLFWLLAILVKFRGWVKNGPCHHVKYPTNYTKYLIKMINKGNSSIPLFKTHKSMDKNKIGVTN